MQKQTIISALLLLLFPVASHAQEVRRQAMVRVAVEKTDIQSAPVPVPGYTRHQTARTAGKGTIARSRTYNYVDHMAIENGDIRSSADYVTLPYMWYSPDMYAMFNAQVKDTIRLNSFGMTFHPYFNGYNDPNAYSSGILSVREGDSYLVDSVIVYGVYRRNNNKPAVVDTLRISYTYGFEGSSNVVAYYYLAPLATRFAVDTLFSAVVEYDSVRKIIRKPAASSGPAILHTDILLRQNDTATGAFGIRPSIRVPAGDLFSVAVTFRSGDTYVPYSDTAFVSTAVSADNPYKYGMFRPAMYKQHLNSFPTYEKVNYNAGQFVQLPERPAPSEYSATWLWISNPPSGGVWPSNYQFPDIDFVVKCDSCAALKVQPAPVARLGNPFPNPAANKINIPVRMQRTADLEFSVFDMTGRNMTRAAVGTVPANSEKNLIINTDHWPDGVYFMSITADGYHESCKFTVAHQTL